MTILEKLKEKGLVLATGNSGKIREFNEFLNGLGIPLYTYKDFPSFDEPEENADTFEGNAEIKARAAFKILNKPVLSDDSGLSVNALGGAPGVQTARFGGTGLSDKERRGHLLNELGNVPGEKRTAEFTCVLCLSPDGEEFYYFRGVTPGRILEEDTGEKGFGYDPVFFCDEAKKSYGELEASQKSLYSHRGKAVKKLVEFLEKS